MASVSCRTDREPLPGGEIADLEMIIHDAVQEGTPRDLAERLSRSYGSETPAITRLSRTHPDLAAPIVAGYPAIRAELVYALRREMAMTLSDLLIRRTHLFYEVTGHAVAEAAAVVDLVAAELGWDAGRKASELAAYLDDVHRGAAFRTELREKFGKAPPAP